MITIDTSIGFDILYYWSNPQGRNTQIFQVIQSIDYTLPIPTMITRWCVGIHIIVVVHVAIGETVHEKLIDNLVSPITRVASHDKFVAFRVGVDAGRYGDKDAEYTDSPQNRS